MSRQKYYIVEARYPVEIMEALSPDEAAMKASRILRNKFNIDTNNWYIRVFEFGSDDEHMGPAAEYFCNPQGTKFRLVEQNIRQHEELVAKNQTPKDI